MVVQKRHFAKARGALQTNRHSPPSNAFSAFPEWKGWKSTPSLPESSRNQSAEKTFRQKFLDDFENTRPVVKKLQSLRPHSPDGPKRKRTAAENIRSERPDFTIDRRSAPIVTGTQASSTYSHESEEPAPGSSTRNASNRPVADGLEAQRRKLLGMDDWVGIERTKPARIDFTDMQDRDQIGKRRKLSQTRPKVVKKRIDHRPLFNSVLLSSQHLLSQADISVRIGSAVDRSVNNEKIERSRGRPDYESVPSEDMFLDSGYEEHDRNQKTNEWVNNADSQIEWQQSPPAVESCHTGSVCAFAEMASSQGPDSTTIKPIGGNHPTGFPPHILARGQEDPAEDLEMPAAYGQQHHQEPTQLRLIFDQIPRPAIGSSDETMDGPIIHNNFPEQNSVIEASDVSSPPPKASFALAPHLLEPTPGETKNVGTSPLSVATSKELAQLHSQAFRSPREVKASEGNPRGNLEPANPPLRLPEISPSRRQLNRLKAFLGVEGENGHGEGDVEGEVEDTWMRFLEFECSETQNKSPSPARLGIQALRSEDRSPVNGTKRAASENQEDREEAEENHWKNFLRIGILDDQSQRSSPTRPASKETHMERYISRREEPTKAIESQHAPPDHRPMHIPDGEQLWRQFVLGSDEDSQDSTISEEHAKKESAPSSTHPAHTQPSMIAEAATSPLKQNPHLAADQISESAGLVLDGVSMLAKASTTSPEPFLDYADRGVNQTTKPHLLRSRPSSPLQPSLAHPALPFFYTEQSSSSPRGLSSPPAGVPSSSEAAKDTNPQGLTSSDRSLNYKGSPSSLQAQASSTHQRSPLPPITLPSQYYSFNHTKPTHRSHTNIPLPSSETDELAWSPSRTQRSTGGKKGTVFFTRPRRYVSTSPRAERETVFIGRKGKEPGGLSTGKGLVREVGRNEIENGDDIEDD